MTAPTPTPAPLNAGEREELARLAGEATPGPWTCYGDHLVWPSEKGPAANDPICGVNEDHEECAAYIAAASPDRILALLTERDALAERVERAKALADAIPSCAFYIDGRSAYYSDEVERLIRAALDVSPRTRRDRRWAMSDLTEQRLADDIRQKRGAWIGGGDGDFDLFLARGVLASDWLAAHDAEVAAQARREALTEAAQAASLAGEARYAGVAWAHWLRDRAEREGGQ